MTLSGILIALAYIVATVMDVSGKEVPIPLYLRDLFANHGLDSLPEELQHHYLDLAQDGHRRRMAYISAQQHGTSSSKFASQQMPAAFQAEVMSHRGFPGTGGRPEETLAGMQAAVAAGTEWLEMDVSLTKDNKLICRHDLVLDATTDVLDHPEFSSRRATKDISVLRKNLTRMWVSDFTLAEIKTLRAIESFPAQRPGNTVYNGLYRVIEFEDILAFVRGHEIATGKKLKIVVELKESTYHHNHGFVRFEEILINMLSDSKWNLSKDQVVIQSFEPTSLRDVIPPLMQRANVAFDLLQLVESPFNPMSHTPADWLEVGDTRTYEWFFTEEGLAATSEYAQWIVPWKGDILPLHENGTLSSPLKVNGTNFIQKAHEYGLKVAIYTIRTEPYWQSPSFGGYPEAEILMWKDLGIDAIITDNTDRALKVLQSPDFCSIDADCIRKKELFGCAYPKCEGRPPLTLPSWDFYPWLTSSMIGKCMVEANDTMCTSYGKEGYCYDGNCIAAQPDCDAHSQDFSIYMVIIILVCVFWAALYFGARFILKSGQMRSTLPIRAARHEIEGQQSHENEEYHNI